MSAACAPTAMCQAGYEYAVLNEMKSSKSPSFVGIPETSGMFYKAANGSILVYAAMVVIFYTITPSDELVYLNFKERQAALVAIYTQIVATMLLLIPFAVRRRKSKKNQISAIVYSAVVVQSIAIVTNGMLAFCPVIVRIDIVTHAPVYLNRWCEWVPLAGFMTFLSEGIELKRDKSSVRNAMLASSMQSFSCLAGGVLCAYATSTRMWLIYMTFSILLFLVIFPRVIIKRDAFHNFVADGVQFGIREKYDRLRFAYTLMATCSVVWAVLVVFYAVNMFIHRVLPKEHPIRDLAPVMVCDTVFDVIAKALYMKWIVDVHFAVFDTEGRAMRQLSELRNLMSVLWNQSSDVIIVSVRHGNRIVSILSPSFVRLLGTEKATTTTARDKDGKALMMEIERPSDEDNPQRGDEVMQVAKAAYVDTAQIPYEKWSNYDNYVPGERLDAADFVATNGKSLVGAAWNRAISVDEDSHLLTYPFVAENGEERKSEIRVSRHGLDAIVCVVRDVTERYRRFEAERQAHAEVLRRQKDAQSQTRFVRHEVKNGLLAGIELCDTLKNEIDAALQSLMPRLQTLDDFDTSIRSVAPLGIPDGETAHSEADVSRSCNAAHKARKGVENLDLLLHEVLETVLAEAMARDVINEIYKPRSESLDVLAALTSSVSTKSGKTERFPIEVRGKDMPFLRLDPQLLRYIHRNAVSNAAKYGKPGGKVNTVLSYDSESKTLTMNVINEPGADQARIMRMGHDKANAIVFSQGTSLHDDGSIISSGDGAWIIAKCAKTMGGTCAISFEVDKTVFSFQTKVEPIIADEIVCAKDFTVPADTIGIAVDDSKIQRKLMRRMLSNVGVKEEMLEVIGETPAEVMGLKEIIVAKLDEHPDSRVLIMIDENLDYGSTNSEQAETAMISGSLTMKKILDELTPEQEKRVLSLVRSANDSAEDVAMYTERTHGFVPKAPMHKERVREILAPLWTQRFMHKIFKI